MNIWIIDHYSSEPKYGGFARQYEFAKALGKRGYKVVVISSAFSHFSFSYIGTEKINYSQVSDNARYAYLKTSPYKKSKSFKRFINSLSFVHAVKQYYKQIVKDCGKPDLVVGCSMHPFTWIGAQYVAKKTKARFFAEVRDLWPATQIYNHGLSPRHPKAVFFGKLEKWAYDHAEKIIYSMARGDDYICGMLGYPREKVLWIDQPLDCERFDLEKKRFSELPLSIRNFVDGTFLCVFTGYYVDYEGVMEMLEAAKIIRDKKYPIKFLFVGSGRAEEAMRSYAKDNSLSNVLIEKRISKELIPAVLDRADICLVNLAVRGNENSYRFDASKNKITEYLYSNSCTIYGTYIKDQFVATSGSGYTITPFDANQFAEKVIEVYNMPEQDRRAFGENGKKYVLSHNTLDILMDKYTDLIEA